MPNDLSATIDKLKELCRTKPACTTKGREGADFNILGKFLGSFAKFEPKRDPTFLLLRCDDGVREKLEHAYPGAVALSTKMKWDTKGWHWTDVQLNSPVPMETLQKLIDDSYELVLRNLSENEQFQVELVGRHLSAAELLDELLRHYGLSGRRAEILKLARQSVLLKTLPADSAATRTFIGGAPFLPADMPWPEHSGKPLAFLAQIDLAEIGKVAKLPDLPPTGLFCLFSVYGWQDPDGADPLTPGGEPADDWTQIYFVDAASVPAQPRKTPSKVQPFPRAAVQPVPVLSLPCTAGEPALAAAGFSGDEAASLVDMASTYNNLLSYQLGHPARHLLLGFADFVQYVTQSVAEQNLKLLFQIASDKNTNMCWGDGGYLYFFIKPENLNPLDLYGVVTDYQCG